jgi:uncharacterized repeat protein (TIGR03803 family)
LIADAAGNLYGTTPNGGSFAGSYCGGTGSGCGTVFKLVHNSDGSWTENVLHRFNHNGTDGVIPYAALIQDTAGNLYGTTFLGGTAGAGTVFKLSPNGDGSWTEEILHSFQNNGKDGENPYASLVIDSLGRIYGTTEQGGNYSSGTVFELRQQSPGVWLEEVIYSFGNGPAGKTPAANLIFGASGTLYGTTDLGSNNNCGTVFELKPTVNDWSQKILYSFKGHTDGCNPSGGVVLDALGNLWGTTYQGGQYASGTVFKLSPGVGGPPWTEQIVHSFSNGTADGANPSAGLTLGADGNFYGTTFYGGQFYSGSLFQVTP